MRSAVLSIGVLAACGAHVPPVPGQGGPAWSEVTSPHFTVWTDAAPEQISELVTRMERMRAILNYAAFPAAPAEGRTLAIVLRDDAELRAMTATGQARPFAAPVAAPLWQPVIVLSAARTKTIDRTVAHELTHAISFGVVHHQPRWFAEGMASYFQTAGLDPQNDIVEIGGAPAGEQLDLDRTMPVAELFQWTAMTRDEGPQYRTAWALFFFLVNQHGAELQRFARLLDAAGAAVELHADVVERLWDQAFPSLGFRDVDHALRDWLANGSSYTVQRLKIAIPPPALRQRSISDADVYAIRALLLALTGKQADARADIAAALAREPTQVLARILAMLVDHAKPTLAEVQAIARAHADDFRAWMLVADASRRGDPAVSEDARGRACALASANPALAPPAKLCAPENR